MDTENIGFYNMTGIGDAINYLEYMSGINEALDGYIGVFLMIVTFIFSWSITGNLDVYDSILVSSFTTAIISSLLFALDWLAYEYTIIAVVVLVLSLLLKFTRGIG